MEIASLVEVENDLKCLGAAQLRQERQEISRQLKSLQDQIGDLAFNNYRTYADAGRTTQDCTDSFTEISEKLREVSGEVSSLQEDLKTFYSCSKNVEGELSVLKSACSKESPLWEVLSLPSRMDVCIRSGYYEAAYSLTNYGMLMQQHSMVKNPLMKLISDRLVKARSLLLEELFNKFSGPLDLAASLQVVNNVRKMPYLTPTQLRVSILQHKDLYLEKQLLDIASHPDFAIAAIDVYRTCMHDTLVLYLSVFPENETLKKDPTIDPRWEQWPTSSPSVILGQWANRNISRLLDLIHRYEMKSGVDMASVWSKLMSLASTFGRMGLDFRPQVVKSLTSLIIERFRSEVKQSTTKLVNNVKVLAIASGEISGLFNPVSVSDAPRPSPEISMWDDICVYANDLINALNGMRYSHTTLILSAVVVIMKESLITVLSWISQFNSSPMFSRAVRIFCLHLAPFLSQSIRYLFPYILVSRLFGSSVSKQQYEVYTELDARELAASCDGSERVEDVLLPMLQKKTLADIDMEALRRTDAQPHFFIDDEVRSEIQERQGDETDRQITADHVASLEVTVSASQSIASDIGNSDALDSLPSGSPSVSKREEEVWHTTPVSSAMEEVPLSSPREQPISPMVSPTEEHRNEEDTTWGWNEDARGSPPLEEGEPSEKQD